MRVSLRPSKKRRGHTVGRQHVETGQKPEEHTYKPRNVNGH